MIQAIPDNPDTSWQGDRRPVVCHIIHALGLGGAEVLVDQMVRRMSQRFRCVVAVLDEVGEIGERLRRDGFVVECLNRSPGIDMKCARRLHAFAEQQGVDVLHAHQYTPFFQAMLSRGLTGQRPVVFTEHGRHHPDLPSAKRILANRLMLRRQDRIVACGEAVRTALVKKEGLPAGRVEVIYNGVDLEELGTAAPDARNRIRQEFGFTASDFVVIQVARLHPLKDHRTAVRTMARLQDSRTGLRLLIVGEGEQRAAIEADVAQAGLESLVRLTGSRTDISDLLAASDAFLLTSRSEGIPLTVIEAMAAELPVVATDVGGLGEMVQSNLNGYLAPAGDEIALATALQHLHDDPCLRRGMGEVGNHMAHQRFSLSLMLDRYAAVYQQVLWKRRPKNHTAPTT
jgi:sugar transferase (PEP-CTERM/EpsH1 system associated)